MKKGFTIVESLVAIAILVLVVTGVSGAVQTGISSYLFSKDQIVAFYLAQEGVEQIRNIRDTNGLAGNNWLADIAANSGDPCYFGRSCIVDAVTDTITPCSSGASSCPVLRQDEASGLYGYNSGWDPTRFRRSITISSINADEVLVLVVVDWSKGLIQREFRAKESMLNWQ